jgi:alanyl-tRNA synthetase
MIIHNIIKSTLVTFPERSTKMTSKVIFVKNFEEDSSKVLMITDITPFHPRSHIFPDQPADIGIITIEDKDFRVIDVLTGAINLKSGQLYLDKENFVKRKTLGWIFIVAHVLDVSSCNLNFRFIKNVQLKVNKQYRKRLSASHSADHIATLALNKATKGLWKKKTLEDSLGNPDLNRLSIKNAKLNETRSIDHFRFGKSLRKKGFDVSTFFLQLNNIEKNINQLVAEWIGVDSRIEIAFTSLELDANRYWKCELPDGNACIPCGGTHVQSLTEFESIEISIKSIKESPEIIMEVIPTLRLDYVRT